MKENSALDFVKPTPFEELCDRIKKRNAVRDFAFFTLKEISKAYFFMRKILKMEYLPASWEDINCVNEAVKKVGKGEASGYDYMENQDFKDKKWNPQNQKIDPEAIKELVHREPFFFPPNTQELLDERLAQEKTKKEVNVRT